MTEGTLSSYEPLVGNKAVEDAAVAWVMELERRAGRVPVDRRFDAAYPADIDSPPLTIEVKAAGKSSRGQFLWLEVAQVDRARVDPSFALYVVENVQQGDPRKFVAKVFTGDGLAQLLERAKERRYFEVPMPVAVHDSAPAHEALAAGPVEPERSARGAFVGALLPARVSTIPLRTTNGVVSITSVALEFQRFPGPKLTWQETYGKTQVVGDHGGRSCAEVEIVKRLRAAGWDAGWIDSFGSAPAPWRPYIVSVGSLPSHVRARVDSVQRWLAATGAKAGSGRWDVAAWKGDEVAYIESKGATDSIRPTQIAWLEAALAVGEPAARFAIVNWTVG